MAAPTPVESFRRASLLTRTLLTVVSLLALFTVFVGAVSLVAVMVTKTVFPPADEQSLASQPGASEAEEPGPALPSPEKAAPAKTRRGSGKQQGDSKE